MNPWMSWTLAIAACAAAYFYYNGLSKPQNIRARAASVSDAVAGQAHAKAPRRREEKTKSKARSANAAGVAPPSLKAETGDESVKTANAEASKKRKLATSKGSAVPTAKGSAKAPVSAPRVQEPARAVEEDDGGKEWAQQLANLKKGTNLAPPVRTDSRNRTVKQSAAGFSSASSNAADADDDMSPAASPSLDAGDVSDMLEPAPAAPSVLRLTEPANAGPSKQARKQAAFEVQETKKQRQNRKKIEERKLQREAEERERQALLEKQRRTAREARGEPAKNGMPASKPPAVSAWAAETARRVTGAPAVQLNGAKHDTAPLLDTFDHDNESTASSTGALGNSTARTSTASNWGNELPSEEDQLKLAQKLSEDDSGWATVPKGKKQKKRTVGAEAGEREAYTSDAASVEKAPLDKVADKTAETTMVKPSTTSAVSAKNGTRSLSDSGYDADSHPDSSSWTA